MADTLEQRCARLQQPVTDLVALSLSSAYRTQDHPELVRAISVVRAIMADDASEIPAGPFREWIPIALSNLDRMAEAMASGDAARSYAILTDKHDGFIRLTIGCAAFPGWASEG